MNARTRVVRTSLVAMSCIVTSLFASACQGPPAEPALPDRGASLRGPVSPPPLHDLVADNRAALGLSEDEERAIRQLAEDARERLDGYHALIEERRETLSHLLEQTAPDRDAVRAAIEALGAAETQLRQGEIQVLLDIRARLSSDQRAALAALAAEASARPGEHAPRPTENRPPRPPRR